MLNRDNLDSIINSDVYDADGDKIGSVGQVYLDDATGEPSWVSVATGWFGSAQTFIPVNDASLDNDGLRVPYSKDLVKDAPRVDADQHLSREEEEQLYAHYSRTDYNDWDGRSFDADDRDRDRDLTAGGVAGTAGLAGADYDRNRVANTDGNLEMTRSEERLNVGKEQVETGRVRLRKYVTTDQQTVSVPVQKEVLSVERTPVEGGQTTGPIGESGDQVEEIVLREERPVVSKETVAVENVAINKDVVTENREVTESVAKEHIEVEGDGVTGDTTGRGFNSDADRVGTDRVDTDRDGDDRSLWQKAKDAVDPDRDGDVLETGTERRTPDNR